MSLRDRLASYLAGDLVARRVSEVETRLRAEADTRVREALSAGLNRADQKLLEDGYRRLSQSGGDRSLRDLSPLAQDQMLEYAYWLWESNPLAQWLVEVVVDFVWGEGGKLESTDDQVKKVIDAFWTDPVNKLGARMEDFVRELGLQGELVLPVAVNDVDGHTRLGYVDPREINEIKRDPDNALILETVVLKGVNGQPGKRLRVVREETWRASSRYGLLMPAVPGTEYERDPHSGRPYDGSCLVFQVNKLSGATRGRSDLLSLIDWLDGYDAALFDQVDRAQHLDSFVWDVTLKGQTEDQIAAWLAKNRKVRRAQIRAHNEQVEWNAVAPDIKASDKDAYFRLMRGQILGSRSIPEHFYGLGGEVNLATAKAMDLPTVKRMTRRQNAVKEMMLGLGRFAVHQAVRTGALSMDAAEASATLAASLPELSMKDTSAIATALTQLSVSLSQAAGEGWIKRETAAKLFALVASQLGHQVDADQEVTAAGEPTDRQTQDYDPTKVRRLRDRLEPES